MMNLAFYCIYWMRAELKLAQGCKLLPIHNEVRTAPKKGMCRQANRSCILLQSIHPE